MTPENSLEIGAFICFRLRKGDESAFQTVYKLFGKKIFVFVMRIVGDRVHAEDIVSEAFISLWKQRETFQNLEGARAFLFTVAKNHSLNYLKHLKRKNKAHCELLYLNGRFNLESKTGMSEKELLKLIFSEAKKLPYLASKIFAMIFIDGMTVEEIANCLGMPKQNVRNNKSRALDIVRMNVSKRMKSALWFF